MIRMRQRVLIRIGGLRHADRCGAGNLRQTSSGVMAPISGGLLGGRG